MSADLIGHFEEVEDVHLFRRFISTSQQGVEMWDRGRDTLLIDHIIQVPVGIGEMAASYPLLSDGLEGPACTASALMREPAEGWAAASGRGGEPGESVTPRGIGKQASPARGWGARLSPGGPWAGPSVSPDPTTAGGGSVPAGMCFLPLLGPWGHGDSLARKNQGPGARCKRNPVWGCLQGLASPGTQPQDRAWLWFPGPQVLPGSPAGPDPPEGESG